ncbi:MAG: NnrU family protein [Candidatus Binatia bacterium]
MESALVVALLWLLFGGTHIGLAAGPIRGRLVARLGEGGFLALFSLVASVLFTVLVMYYAAYRWEGAPGLAVSSLPALRWPLMVFIAIGVVLMIASLAAYSESPYAIFNQTIRSPRGVERITRHPFFAGVALLALAHALLATRLVGTVFFSGLALLAIIGARHQDTKLLVRRGQPYADYLAATSIVPFAAIVSGRQRIVWRELPVGALAAGLVLTFALRAVHDGIFAHGGLWVIVGVLGGAAVATLQSWRRARRVGVVATSARV